MSTNRLTVVKQFTKLQDIIAAIASPDCFNKLVEDNFPFAEVSVTVSRQ